MFFEKICAPSVWAIAILELALLIFLTIRYVKTKSVLTLLTAIITFGLFYDAFMIALGVFIDPTKGLFFSKMRFILHGVLIPILFTVCSFALDLKKPKSYIFMGATLLVMIVGLAEALSTKLIPETLGGLTRMKMDAEATPMWAQIFVILLSVLSVIPEIITGIVIWKREKTPYLFLSGLLMFIFAAAFSSNPFAFFLTMFGEILMVVFLTLYIFNKEKKII